MNYKDAIALIAYWKENEPTKFQAWSWFGRGLKDAERWQILKGSEDLDSMPIARAVSEFQEHWRFEHTESLETEFIKNSTSTGSTEFNREDHPDSAEARHMRIIKSKNKK